MTGLRVFTKASLVCALIAAAGCGLPAAATTTHSSPVVRHAAPSWHHNNAPGWHGYHRGYGFYGFWPWYFPWTYGYAVPYYGVSFYADAPVTYIEMAPAESGAVQPANSWYYCTNPEGYFPYVKTCPSGWQTVPAQPPAPPGQVPASPASPAVPPVQ